MKSCSSCKTTQPLTEFFKHKRDGYGSVCRTCNKRLMAERRDRSRAKWAVQDAYANPAPKRCSACKESKARTAFPPNPSNYDGLLSTCRSCWYMQKDARKAKAKDAFVEYVDRDVLWERDRGVCYLCGLPADPTAWDLDHIHALDLGGEHSYANAAVSHPSCNRSKSNRAWPDVAFDVSA